jgi:hypothetical protein
MKPSYVSLAFATLLLLAGASAAMAFTTQSGPSVDTMTSSRVADPDDVMDNLANQQSGGAPGSVMSLGGTTLRFGGSSSDSDTGANSRFLTSPAASTVPSQQGR